MPRRYEQGEKCTVVMRLALEALLAPILFHMRVLAN